VIRKKARGTGRQIIARVLRPYGFERVLSADALSDYGRATGRRIQWVTLNESPQLQYQKFRQYRRMGENPRMGFEWNRGDRNAPYRDAG